MNLYEVKSRKLRWLVYAETNTEAKRLFYAVCRRFGLEGDVFGIWMMLTRVKIISTA